jgi:hypothetical protein
MKIKHLVLAVILLAALAGAVALLNRPPAGAVADARIGQPLATSSLVDQAAGFRITAEAGKIVELKKSAEGGWRVSSYYDFPADVEKLARFASELTEAKISRLVTTNPAAMARLEFKDTRIQLLDAAGQSLFELVLGKNADTGGGRFVRLGTEDKAYLASLSTFLDSEAKNWADPALLKFNPDDIAKIELTFPAVATTGDAASPPRAEETLVATRAKMEDAFVAEHPPAGQQLKANAFTTVFSNLTAPTLRFSDTAALDDPAVTAAKASARKVKLTTFDGKTIALLLGRKPEEKKPKPVVAAKPADSAATPSPILTPVKEGDPTVATAAKTAEPEFELVPPGNVYISITHSDAAAPVNALMAKRAFQIADFIYTALPQKPEELFESMPAPKPAEPAKP